MGLKTPVAFLIFNRPETTEQVFAAIRAARPEKMLVVADGPRVGRPGEAELCAATRAIIKQVDWPCEVITNFADTNMGCRQRIFSGLDWVFSLVEEAIILEDDCLPTASFFGFCAQMLERYRHNQQVMMVAGTNFLLGEGRCADDFYFSNMVSIWGWATWRRSWEKRIVNIAAIDKSSIVARYNNKTFSRYILKMLIGAKSGAIDTWDIQWCYSVIKNKGLSVTPVVNQIKNIGYIGTHTSGASSPFFNMKTRDLDLAGMQAPDACTVSAELDSIAMDNIIRINKIPGNLLELLVNKVTKWIKS